MSMFSAFFCTSTDLTCRIDESALPIADSGNKSDDIISNLDVPYRSSSRKVMKRSQSWHGPPCKRTLSDVSSDSDSRDDEEEEDIDLVNFEYEAPAPRAKLQQDSQLLPYTTCVTTNNEINSFFVVPPAPSQEKCARNAKAKMVLLMMDNAEEMYK